MTEEEIIELLTKACDLFDRIQEKKAVLEAEQIVARCSLIGKEEE